MKQKTIPPFSLILVPYHLVPHLLEHTLGPQIVPVADEIVVGYQPVQWLADDIDVQWLNLHPKSAG